jgi:photosystem II stability/assembly factor-like uncharacterized protein
VAGLAAAVAVVSGAVALLAQSHRVASLDVTTAIPAASAGDGIGNLRMFSTSAGWAQRLDGGAILHTARGVGHWTLASPPTVDRVLAAAYLDAGTAQVLTVPGGAGSATTLQSWVTTDGGSAWSRGGGFAVQGYNAGVGGALDFVDPEHGWYSQLEAADGLSGTALYGTTDGGAQWSEVAVEAGTAPGTSAVGTIPRLCYGLTATFASPSDGWLTGSCLTGPAPLYATQDGGRSWSAQALPALPFSPAGGTSFPPVFTSPGSGTLLTENQSLTAVTTSLFATGDGGGSWLLRSTSIGSPVADGFVDADRGWLVTAADGAGSATDIFTTADGGAIWTRLGAFPYAGLSLDFLTAKLGWAAEDLDQQDAGPAYLIQTDDGGRTWTGVVPEIPTPSPSP